MLLCLISMYVFYIFFFLLELFLTIATNNYKYTSCRVDVCFVIDKKINNICNILFLLFVLSLENSYILFCFKSFSIMLLRKASVYYYVAEH